MLVTNVTTQNYHQCKFYSTFFAFICHHIFPQCWQCQQVWEELYRCLPSCFCYACLQCSPESNARNCWVKTNFQRKIAKYPKRLPSAAFSARRRGWVPVYAQTVSRVHWPESFFMASFVKVSFTSRIRPFFLDWAVYHCHLQLWPQYLCRKSFFVKLLRFVLCGKWSNLPSCKSFFALTMGNTSTCFAFSCIISLG